jgi:hypothetical protein
MLTNKMLRLARSLPFGQFSGLQANPEIPLWGDYTATFWQKPPKAARREWVEPFEPEVVAAFEEYVRQEGPQVWPVEISGGFDPRTTKRTAPFVRFIDRAGEEIILEARRLGRAVRLARIKTPLTFYRVQAKACDAVAVRTVEGRPLALVAQHHAKPDYWEWRMMDAHLPPVHEPRPLLDPLQPEQFTQPALV